MENLFAKLRLTDKIVDFSEHLVDTKNFSET